MWRGFVIIAEIIVLVTVLRLPFVQYLFEDAQNTVSDWYEYAASWQDRHALEGLRHSAQQQFQQLRPFQQDYLLSVTANRHSVLNFQKTYCGSDEINPYINGVNLERFCREIAQARLQKNNS